MLSDPEVGDWLFEILYKKLDTVNELIEIWQRWDESTDDDPAIIRLKERLEIEIRERIRKKQWTLFGLVS